MPDERTIVVSMQQDVVYTELDSVIQEILYTERSYVADLTSLVMADLGDDCPLRFPLLRLQRLHMKLLASLEAANGSLGALCQAFLDCDFRVYAEYCASFPGALEWLRQVRAATASPRLHRNLHQHQHMPQQHQQQQQALVMLHLRLPLEAHLLQPVQRIARYPLLLRRLTAAADGDEARPSAARAAARMAEAAAETDERQRRQQQAERLLRAAAASSSTSEAPTFTPGGLRTTPASVRWPGPLLLEASFRILGHRNPRRVLLFGRAVLLTKCRNGNSAASAGADGELSLRAVFWCDRLALIDSMPREPLAFRLLALDKPPAEAASATFRAESLSQKRLWCGELRRIILEAISGVGGSGGGGGGGGVGGVCGGAFEPISESSMDLASRRRNLSLPRRSRSDAGNHRGRRPGRPFEPCLAAYAQQLRVQEVITEDDVQPLLTALWGLDASIGSSGAGGGGSFKRRDSLIAASNLVGSLLRRRGSGCSLTSSPRLLRRRATERVEKSEKASLKTPPAAASLTEDQVEEASEPVKLRGSRRSLQQQHQQPPPPILPEGLASLIESLPFADADERARLSMAAAAVAAAAVADDKEWRNTKDWSAENVFWKRALLDSAQTGGVAGESLPVARQPKSMQTHL